MEKGLQNIIGSSVRDLALRAVTLYVQSSIQIAVFFLLNMGCDVVKIYYPVQSWDFIELGSNFRFSRLTGGPYALSRKVPPAGDQDLKFSN